MIRYYKQQLYRDVVNVNVTIIYVGVVVVAVYAVEMGWENVVKFVVVQMYAVKMAYLLNKCGIDRKWKSMCDNSISYNH